jgi:hypothetical protein
LVLTVLLGAALFGGAFLGRRGAATIEPDEIARARRFRSSWRGRRVDAALAVVIVVSAPVAAWWLIGDMSEVSLSGRYPPDYVLRAPEIPGWIVPLLGALALLATVACTGFLVRSVLRGTLDRRWVSAVGCLALAGLLLAAIGRVFTAGTHGANIGAGLAMMFGGPVVIALVGTALLRGYKIRRS